MHVMQTKEITAILAVCLKADESAAHIEIYATDGAFGRTLSAKAENAAQFK